MLKRFCTLENSGFFLIALFLWLAYMPAKAQSFLYLKFQNPRNQHISLPFKLIHNLIIIPVTINGSDTLNFIVDTGVSNTMLTSFAGANNLSFSYAREITLYGLGEGDEIKAYHSFGNTIELPGVIGYNHNVIILETELNHLSQGLGMNINGIIGCDLFESFTVEIDYQSQLMTLYNMKYYHRKIRKKRVRKGEVIPMQLINRKPYITVAVKDSYGNATNLKLLIDSGASHALSVFASTNPRMQVPVNALYTFIGLGLSGEIYGSISRITELDIGRIPINDPLVTYPDEIGYKLALENIGRNGSLGADILKRFRVDFDYQKGEMILRPNRNYKDAFRYNLSGMEIVATMPGLPLYQISKIRQESPASEAGLKEGDQIISINGHAVANFSLGYLVEVFQSKPGRKVRVGYQRDEEKMETKVILKDPIPKSNFRILPQSKDDSKVIQNVNDKNLLLIRNGEAGQ